jgi:trans-aconitate methyltransferase
MEFYYDLLAPLAARVELWATEYVHVMDGPGDIVPSPMMRSARASRRSIWRRFDKATPRALMDACFFRFAASSGWRTGSNPL